VGVSRSRTALIVTDVQNDFADPAGGLAVRGAEAIVPIINRAIAGATAAGEFVVYTQDWHPESTPHFAKDGGIWPVHCVAGTWGAEFHPELVVVGPSVRKGSNGEDGYSGFTMRDPLSGQTIPTELEALLRSRGVERVRVCGLATDYCVRATALDAVRLGFETTLLADAVAAVDLEPGDDAKAIDELRAAGVELEKAPAERASADELRADELPADRAPADPSDRA
jgi:nicotinamidase/pyrazinamidase